MALFVLAFFVFLAVMSMLGWVADSRENRDWRYAGRTSRDLGQLRP
jgi:hypothetical protein